MKRKFLSLAVALLCSVSTWADVDYVRLFSNLAWIGNTGVEKNTYPSKNSVNFGECYYASYGTGFAMKQTVSGLPNGSYEVKVYAHAHHAWIADFDASTMTNVNTLSVNESSQNVPTVDNTALTEDEPTLYTFDDVTVTDGTMTIIFNRENNGANWFTASVKSVVYKGSSEYVDYTSSLTNPSFETGTNSGWTSTGTLTLNYGQTNNSFLIDGSKYAEFWQPNGSIDIKQTVTALKNGLYRLGVSAYARGMSSAKFYTDNSVETAISDKSRYTLSVLAKKDDNITLGVNAVGTGAADSWFAVDNFTFEFLSNAVEVYSPTSFSSNSSATADTWYEFPVASAGWYRINSSAAATLYYTQNGSDDADAITSSNTFAEGDYTFMNLTAGSFYFKSSATSTIKIEAISSSVLQDGDVVTEVFIANPSFEDSDMSSWNLADVFSRQDGSALSGKSGTYYAGSSVTKQTKSISQSLTGLPSGNYLLQARAKVAQFNASSSLDHADLKMGSNATPARYEVEDDYTVAFNAASDDASANISFGGKINDYGYFYCDNFTLTYYSTLPDVDIESLTSEVMAGDVRAALTSASSTYNSSKTVANYNALQTAIVNAKTSIAAFAANTGTDADWTGVIQNPSFETGNYNGWTTTKSNDTQAAENANAIYTMSGVDGTYVFNTWATGYTISQTLKNLPAGNYKLTAVMGTDAGATFRLKMGDETGYATSVDKGTGVTVTVYANLTAKGDLTISADAGGSMWYKVDNFQLTYNPTLPASVTAVEGKMNSTVESTQTTAVTDYNATSGQTIDNMVAAQAAIYAAHLSKQVYTEITTIKDSYDTKAAALDTKGQAAYAAGTSATKYTNGTYETASEAETAYRADYVTAIKAQDEDNAVYTDVLVNPSFESFGANNVPTGWTLTLGNGSESNAVNEKKKSGRLVEGGGDYHFGYWTNSTNGSEVYQTINLPAGSYNLSVYVGTAVGTTVEFKAGTLATDSKTADSTDPFKMEVSFSLTSATDVRVSIGTTTGGAWYNMDECQLILTESYYANDADYAALNSAIDDVDDYVLGFENGEYAPYENIDALTKLAAANAIDQETSNTKTSVQTATTNLIGATWTANDGEVNAIAGGYNLDSYTHSGDYDVPNGWSNGGYNTRIVGITESLIGSNPGLAGAVNERAILVKYSTTYGESTGYTMPLKANTWYALTFKYGLWNEKIEIVKNLSVTDPNGATITVQPGSVSKNEGDVTKCANVLSTAWYDKTVWFKTGSTAGDYVLNITGDGNQRQMVFSGLILKKATFDIDENSDCAPEVACNAKVTITRTFNASAWNTLVLPFDMSLSEAKEVFGEDVVLANYLGTEEDLLRFSTVDAKIEANEPLLIWGASTVNKKDIGNWDLVVGTPTLTPVEASYSFVGSYDASTTLQNGDYFIGSDNKLYYINAKLPTMKGTRGFFRPVGVGTRALSFSVDGETTGIMVVDGKEMLGLDSVYTLAGQRVSKPTKGLYIKNGKKVVIK